MSTLLLNCRKVKSRYLFLFFNNIETIATNFVNFGSIFLNNEKVL